MIFDPQNIITTAQMVFEKQITALQAVKEAFDHPQNNPLAQAFQKAVESCVKTEGKIVVTGMGKSGHIGRKIAATLASTGSSAIYVHPAEASHGDLGMIESKDIVLALSNSGNTPEMSSIIEYTTRFNIPLIALTSGIGSELDKAATISLILPQKDEACTIVKAPTTSTTMALVTGDALAIALLELKGFSSDDFYMFHPGGKIGAALKRVDTMMEPNRDNLFCDPQAPISKVIETIENNHRGCVGIIDISGALIGIITDGDLRRNYSKLTLDSQAQDIMTKNPLCLPEDSLAAEGLKLLTENKITSLFIVDEAMKPKGLINIHNYLTEGVL